REPRRGTQGAARRQARAAPARHLSRLAGIRARSQSHDRYRQSHQAAGCARLGRLRRREGRSRQARRPDPPLTEMTAAALIRVRGLAKTFKRGALEVQAIRGFDLDIAEGEFVAIVGPSGCGKSTFLHILGGFEPLTAGELLVDGKPVTAPGPDRGVVFQEFALYPWRSVEGNIA